MSASEHHSVDSNSGDAGPRDGLSHLALLYHGPREFVDAVTGFVDEGLAAGEPVMVVVPRSRMDMIKAGLKGDGTHFADMTELGRNPGRLIPAVQEFLEQFRDHRTRLVGEPIWPGRSADEIAEATRHEALINVALADFPVTVLCPYDQDQLPAKVIEDSWRTHPMVVKDGQARASDDYCDPADVFADEAWPLPPSPAGAEVREFRSDSDLSLIRSWVQHFAWASGMTMGRVDDLCLAVSEIVGNALQHGGAGGALRVWRDDGGAVMCEVRDVGRIADPLVGRYPPGPDLEATGLWLVNQLCDLVAIRSGVDGTQVRLTVNL
jgi:anti-sigma regulatory factor (Ser/Thr protein kinase)